MTLIPAAPGWRVAAWSREADGLVGLPIVAWVHVETHGDQLEPLVLDTDQLGVGTISPTSRSLLFVGILSPGDELIDWEEAGEQAAAAEREHEDREHAARMREVAHPYREEEHAGGVRCAECRLAEVSSIHTPRA